MRYYRSVDNNFVLRSDDDHCDIRVVTENMQVPHGATHFFAHSTTNTIYFLQEVEATLQIRIEHASHDIHGGCTLYFDGDCFDPPPWSCSLFWAMGKVTARGDTPEEAIELALRQKKETKELNSYFHKPEETSFDDI